jgi:hypothetical protein
VDIHVVGEGLLGLVAGGMHDEARVHAGVGRAARAPSAVPHASARALPRPQCPGEIGYPPKRW